MSSLIEALSQQNERIKQLEINLNKLEQRFKQQFIFERILFGIGGDAPFDYDESWKVFKKVLHPFLEIPGPQDGATRKYRLHAIYSDTCKPPHSTEVSFQMYQFDDQLFYFKGIRHTHGDPLENDQQMDFSDFVTLTQKGGHAQMAIRLTKSGSRGRLFYLGLQFWDFFA
jgi:hypothetical protein